MNKYIEVLSKGLTPENTLLILFGTILYFVMEFKSKQSDASFSILIWIKNNWYNLIINLVAIASYFILVEDISKLESFAIGLAPNYIVDRLMEMKKKYAK